MESMIDRVAKAIYAQLQNEIGRCGHISYGDEELTDIVIDGTADLLKVAKSAIEALREPTDAMKKAGEFHDISFSYGDEDSFGYVSMDDAGDIFRDMIDAALKEQVE